MFHTFMSNWILGHRRTKDMAVSAMPRTLNTLHVSLTLLPFTIHLLTRSPLLANHRLQRKIFDRSLVVA